MINYTARSKWRSKPEYFLNSSAIRNGGIFGALMIAVRGIIPADLVIGAGTGGP